MSDFRPYRKLEAQKRRHEDRLGHNIGPTNRLRVRTEIESITTQLANLDNDLMEIQQRIDDRHRDNDNDAENCIEQTGSRRLPNESQRDFLIRTGKITPFSKIGDRAPARLTSNLQDALQNAEDQEDDE